MTINSERIKSLAMVLDSYASTMEEKKMVLNFTNMSETTENEVIFQLTSAIYDGIAFGNWPWVVARLNSSK